MATLRHPRAGFALSALLALAGCGDDPAGPGSDESQAVIRVSANVSNTPIDLLVVTVSAADIGVAPVFNLPVVNGIASGTVRVPPGTARLFSVTAFEATGEITHEGSALRNVQRGQNPPLAIPLTPRSGQVPLTITFGDFSVEVTPATQELDITTVTATQLTVTVTNAEGAVIQGPDVAWATTDPSRARVDAQGLVTLYLAGEVDIVATYNGIAGIGHLTLTGVAPTTFYADMDNDGFGDPSASITIQDGETPPVGYVPQAGDCADFNPNAYPGALEFYDFVDNDCDGFTDELVAVTVFADQDADGYGGSTTDFVLSDETGAFTPPAGFTVTSGDCNDGDAAISPAASEIPLDGVDNNCNGFTDEELVQAWFDQDLDGFGDPMSEVLAFEPLVVGLVPAGGTPDCDDGNGDVYPGAVEVIGDEVDNDCNGTID